ncbi:MAG: YggT family protein [Chloroflexi bacterium]|nr:YggT family protein [Chloroflexota bacterium]
MLLQKNRETTHPPGQPMVTAERAPAVERYPLAEELEEVVVDRSATGTIVAHKFEQLCFFLFGIVGGLIAIRFALRALGANPGHWMVDSVYAVTQPLVAPFTGIFATAEASGTVLIEPASSIAFLVYGLAAWVLVGLGWLMLGQPRSGLVTTRHTRTSSRPQ